MRLALIASAALVVLLALGALLWLAPARTLDVGRGIAPGTGLEDGSPPADSKGELAEALEEARPQELRTTVSSSTSDEREELPLHPVDQASGDVLVRVVSSEEGAPLAGVRLVASPWPDGAVSARWAKGSEGELGWAPLSDQLGEATFHLPSGEYRIECTSQKDRSVHVEILPGKEQVARVALRSRADLDVHVRVLDAATRDPLDGAMVRVEDLAATGGFVIGITETASTTENGAATLRLPSWCELTGSVSREGYGPASLTFDAGHEDEEHAREVLLGRGARLEGVVYDGNGASLAGVRVIASVTAPDLAMDSGLVWAFKEGREWAAETESDGRYALDGLPPEVVLSLEVRYAERPIVQEPRGLRLEGGEVRVRDFHVEQGGAITGVLLDAEGSAIEGRHLLLVSGSAARVFHELEPHVARTSTDERGRFSFADVQPGTWLVGPAYSAAVSANAPLPLAEVVELPSGVPEVEVELRLQAGLFVSGLCLGPGDEPIAAAHVSGFGSAGMAEAESAADGGFLLGPFRPGELWLSAKLEDDLVSTSISVDAGDRDVVVRLARTSGIRGVVVDAATAAGRRGEVHAVSDLPDALMFMFSATNTRPDGAFELAGLSPGRYVLVARTASGLVSEPVRIDAGIREERALELRVAPGARARLLLPEGKLARLLVDGMAVQLLGSETTLPFRPGAFTVEVLGDGETRKKDASAAAGEVVEVDLR